MKVRKILRDSILVGLCMLTALVIRNTVGPSIRGKLSRVHFPGIEAADAVNQLWQSEFNSELDVIGGEMFMASAVSVYAPQQVDIYAGLSKVANPWLSDKQFQSRGGVIVWEISGENQSPPLGWMKRFPTAKRRDNIHLESRALSGPRAVTVGVLVVPPSPDAKAETETQPDNE